MLIKPHSSYKSMDWGLTSSEETFTADHLKTIFAADQNYADIWKKSSNWLQIDLRTIHSLKAVYLAAGLGTAGTTPLEVRAGPTNLTSASSGAGILCGSIPATAGDSHLTSGVSIPCSVEAARFIEFRRVHEVRVKYVEIYVASAVYEGTIKDSSYERYDI